MPRVYPRIVLAWRRPAAVASRSGHVDSRSPSFAAVAGKRPAPAPTSDARQRGYWRSPRGCCRVWPRRWRTSLVCRRRRTRAAWGRYSSHVWPGPLPIRCERWTASGQNGKAHSECELFPRARPAPEPGRDFHWRYRCGLDSVTYRLRRRSARAGGALCAGRRSGVRPGRLRRVGRGNQARREPEGAGGHTQGSHPFRVQLATPFGNLSLVDFCIDEPPSGGSCLRRPPGRDRGVDSRYRLLSNLGWLMLKRVESRIMTRLNLPR